MNHNVNFINTKKVTIILFCLMFFLYFFKFSQYSICLDLKNCSINAVADTYELYLDSLDMFIIEGGEGNELDYLFYDGFLVHCPSSDSSNILIDTGRVWDGKYMVENFSFFKTKTIDDVLLFRISKHINSFYLVEKEGRLPDITYMFFTNFGCKRSFINQ